MRFTFLAVIAIGCSGTGGSSDDTAAIDDAATEDSFRAAFIREYVETCEEWAGYAPPWPGAGPYPEDGCYMVTGFAEDGCQSVAEHVATNLVVDLCRYSPEAGRACLDSEVNWFCKNDGYGIYADERYCTTPIICGVPAPL